MYYKIQVTPEAKRESLKRFGADKFKINVTEKAERNLANKRALSLLAEHLDVPVRSVRLMSGHKSPHKIVHVRQG